MTSKVVALQAWCKHQCQGYKDVEITNMTTSWRSGLAFCAIIHRYHPELIDFDSLDKDNIYENNKLAFDVAAALGISPFLDPEDMVAMKVPDKLSILTYVSQYYNVFGKQKPKQSLSSLKRIAENQSDVKYEGTRKKRSAANENKDKNRSYLSSEDNCHVCKSKVYLIERHFDDGHLHHHSCFRKLKSSQLGANSKENSNPMEIKDPQPSNMNTLKNEGTGMDLGKNSEPQKLTNAVLKSSKESNLSLGSGISDEKKVSKSEKNLTTENALEPSKFDRFKGNNVAPKSNGQENKALGNVNASDGSKTISDHNIEISSAELVFPKISCSDTFLTSNHQQVSKLNEVVQKNYKLEISDKINSRTSSSNFLDANFNNKLSGVFLTESVTITSSSGTLSPNSSDLSIASFGSSVKSVIDLFSGSDSSYRLTPKPSNVCDILNKNEKGNKHCNPNSQVSPTKSNFKTFSEPSFITENASRDLVEIPSTNGVHKEENKAERPVSCTIPTTAPILHLTTANLILKKPKCSCNETPFTKDYHCGSPPAVAPRNSLFYEIHNFSHSHIEGSTPVKTKVPLQLKLKNPRDAEVSHVEKTNIDNITPVPKPRIKTRHPLSGTLLKSLEIPKPTSNPSSNKASLLSFWSLPPCTKTPASSHQESVAIVFSSTESPRAMMSHTTLRPVPVKPPRLNISGPAASSFMAARNSVGCKSAQDTYKAYKPYQVTCSTTIPIDVHPLSSKPLRPPPRPIGPPIQTSEAPLRKKILPKSTFYFDSISFDESEFSPASIKDSISFDEKSEICKKLKLIDESLKKIEEEGRIMENTIRSDNVDSLSDENMTKWFGIVNRRNELVREETDLLYRCQQVELEKDQASIDSQLRALMMIPDKEKTVSQRFNEDQLIKKLLEIVEKRSNIVDYQEDDRIRYLKEDETLKKTRELSLGGKQKLQKK